MKNRIIVFICFLLSVNLFAGNKKEADTLYVAFWNLENLFDAVDDPEKNDSEFLPSGENQWTNERVDIKLANLASVINSMNDNRGPDVIGVAEVEHQALLDSMIAKYFNNKNYGVAYAESPDARGIDVGIIYNKNKLKFASIKTDTVTLPDKYATRLILNANLIITGSNDTLHFFANHWPSRRGGEKVSEINRITAAKVLKTETDKLFGMLEKPEIILFGDFNDTPSNTAIKDVLEAGTVPCDSAEGIKLDRGLTNLAYKKHSLGEGSYFYRGEFEMIDQIIVSNPVVFGKKIKYICGSFDVYKPLMLVTESGKYKGSAKPTFGGKTYLGGYSDHFPVISKFAIE